MLLREANAIIKKHQERILVDLVALAGKLGATVYNVSDWPDDVSGMIRIDKGYGGSRGYIIYVNKNHHPNWQRFTIACEIAHIMLHEDLIGNGITTDGLYRSGLSNKVEWAANRATVSILMPWSKIHQKIAMGVTSADELAHRFGVSRSAVVIQLKWPWALEWHQSSGGI